MGKTSINSQQPASASSPPLDTQRDDGCPGWDVQNPDYDDDCQAGQIMCLNVWKLVITTEYYCQNL